MDVTHLTLSDLAELKPADNVTDITLSWRNGPSIEKVLRAIKRWRHLCRLTFTDQLPQKCIPPLEVLSHFIMGMKHLSYLHIVPECDDSDSGQLETLRDKVNQLILPKRPNFKFGITRISVL